jgi:FMN phosphatase YigB (HAD superfamily)
LTLRAKARERKPNVGFYQHVFTVSGIDPKQTIFVDDKPENVLTARSFGVHGIVFDNADDLVRQLKNFCENPVERAWSFLYANKKQLTSVTTNGVVLREVLAIMHISCALKLIVTF